MAGVSQGSSRYERSFAGLTGAMIVTVAAVIAFIVWRGLFSGDATVEVEAVDWRESVEIAQGAGKTVVHPRELPDGWKATSVDLVAVGDERWGMGMLTAEGDFVGIRQLDGRLEEIVSTYIDAKATGGEEVTLDSEVATTWRRWSDEGGDTGFSAEVGDEFVLVYGSAPAAEIEAFIGRLTL
jgi:hypothetical protein